ncbi:hypothetical protein [Nitrososphaera viennensis]|uniref:Uncharacterized protein n=2 Tax=Nitrososphaera viennensis TaxID=1034015 RepID=A0A060HSJ0_9ARCH|nr:hypothetical protein [Nitrososphaera viennensis]AIC16137.1 hypothetical protein NVIE_018770 [Nitrososphaera viennensis EN76]UVS68100.1 hypothetical protein NWT39_09330 [Nitrososphaera viennensis]
MPARLPQNVRVRAMLAEHGIDRQFLSMLTDSQARDLLECILYLKEKHKHLFRCLAGSSCN